MEVAQVGPFALAAEQLVVEAHLVAVVTQHLRDVEGHEGVRPVHVPQIKHPAGIEDTRPRPGVDDPCGDRVRPQPVLFRLGRIDPESARVQPEIAPDDERQGEREEAWREAVAEGRDGDCGSRCERHGAAERTPQDCRGVGAGG